MGYLDNSSITVDAVLTKKGREILKDGGNLNITHFTLSDTGVDYTLFNTDHPSGSAFYGEAIENLPMLEASVHAEYNLRNRLFTLNQDTIAMPALVVAGLDVNGGNTLTFDEKDKGFTGQAQINVKLAGYNGGGSMGMYVVVDNPDVVRVLNATKHPGNMSGTGMQTFLTEQAIPGAERYDFSGGGFTLEAKQVDKKGRTSNIFIADIETGATFSFTVTNNILKDPRALLSQPRSGNSAF